MHRKNINFWRCHLLNYYQERELQTLKKKTFSIIITVFLFTILMISVFIGTLEMAKADTQSSDSNGNPDTWSMFHNNLGHTGNTTSTSPTTNHVFVELYNR